MKSMDWPLSVSSFVLLLVPSFVFLFVRSPLGGDEAIINCHMFGLTQLSYMLSRRQHRFACPHCSLIRHNIRTVNQLNNSIASCIHWIATNVVTS